MKKILLTGGGTAGHVTPNLALIPALREKGFEIHYAGRHEGIERQLAESKVDAYHGLSSGKLRRYFNIKNITDAFRIVIGLKDAFFIIKKVKPHVVFSKGGFVTVPVVMAARLSGVPVVIHESDITPGLANRLAFPFARRVCVNFPETLARVPKDKAALTGSPIWEALLAGDRRRARDICGFSDAHKPTALITGGSTGAAAINQCVREALPQIIKKFNVIHLCGKGNTADISVPGYVQFEYVTDELPHLFALADAVISRAGANTINELLALCKPHILIPLTREASRGDQILNAESFEKQGFSMVLPEPEMTAPILRERLDELYANRQAYYQKMNAYWGGKDAVTGTQKVVEVILAAARRRTACPCFII